MMQYVEGLGWSADGKETSPSYNLVNSEGDLRFNTNSDDSIRGDDS